MISRDIISFFLIILWERSGDLYMAKHTASSRLGLESTVSLCDHIKLVKELHGL